MPPEGSRPAESGVMETGRSKRTLRISSGSFALVVMAFCLGSPQLIFSQATPAKPAVKGDLRVIAFVFSRQSETRAVEGKRIERQSETEILPLTILQQGRYVPVENDASDERQRSAVEDLLKKFPTFQVLRWGAAQNRLSVTGIRQQLFQCSELVVGTAEPALKTDDFWNEQVVSDKNGETTMRISRPFVAVSGDVGGPELRVAIGPYSPLRKKSEEFFHKAAKEVAREMRFAFEPGPEEKLTYMHFFRLGQDRLAVAKIWMRGPEKFFPILLFALIPEQGEAQLVAHLATEELLQGSSGYDFIDAAEIAGQPVVFVQYGTTEQVEYVILEWQGGKLTEAFRGGYGC